MPGNAFTKTFTRQTAVTTRHLTDFLTSWHDIDMGCAKSADAAMRLQWHGWAPLQWQLR